MRHTNASPAQFAGFLDAIHARLAVMVADCESCKLMVPWREVADFATPLGEIRRGDRGLMKNPKERARFLPAADTAR